jgi:hypothetical protein
MVRNVHLVFPTASASHELKKDGHEIDVASPHLKKDC